MNFYSFLNKFNKNVKNLIAAFFLFFFFFFFCLFVFFVLFFCLFVFFFLFFLFVFFGGGGSSIFRVTRGLFRHSDYFLIDKYPSEIVWAPRVTPCKSTSRGYKTVDQIYSKSLGVSRKYSEFPSKLNRFEWGLEVSELYHYEPRHDKTNKVTVRPAKTQISLGIKRTADTLIRLGGCPGWSESSLGAQFCHVAAHICALGAIEWATSWENLFMLYANNKGADQSALPRSLISTFVVRCRDSIIPLVSITEISSL